MWLNLCIVECGYLSSLGSVLGFVEFVHLLNLRVLGLLMLCIGLLCWFWNVVDVCWMCLRVGIIIE